MTDHKGPRARPRETTVNRNFALTKDQAQWLRDTAYRRRISQAALVRRALEDLIQRVAADPATLADDRCADARD